MTDKPTARDAIAALQGHEAWAIIRRSTRVGDRDTVGMIGGRRSVVVWRNAVTRRSTTKTPPASR